MITALHQAAGTDAKATDQYAKTALHLACANGSVKIVQALLAAGTYARQRISMRPPDEAYLSSLEMAWSKEEIHTLASFGLSLPRSKDAYRQL